MRMIELGHTGLKISPLGMGTIQITRLEWNQSIKVVREVMDLGINWFDTAHGYLDSELRLGEAFKGKRDRVVIMTKSGAGDSRTLVNNLDESLKRLQTDYVDVFFFHGAGAVEQEGYQAPGGLLETVEAAIREGKIRYLGFSAHRPDLAIKALDTKLFKVAMVPANFIDREYIDGAFLSKARLNNVAVIAMKPFGGGRITGPSVCLKFLKKYPDVIPCIGIEKTSEMVENTRIWEDSSPMSDDELKEMESLKELLGNKYCRACGYCQPCPAGIRIPTVAFLKVYAKQMPRSEVITPYNSEAVDMARNCTECRKCVDRCPYRLSIPEMLKENIAFYEEVSKCK